MYHCTPLAANFNPGTSSKIEAQYIISTITHNCYDNTTFGLIMRHSVTAMHDHYNKMTSLFYEVV